MRQQGDLQRTSCHPNSRRHLYSAQWSQLSFPNLISKKGIISSCCMKTPGRSRPFPTYARLFRYKRLNFGINSAADVFQHTIRQVIGSIPNVINVSDDILVYGITKEDHDKALEATFERLSKCGLTLNPKKCSFFHKELTFFGHVSSGAGVRPDPVKVSALGNAAPPTNTSEVRSVLGLLNYCGRFFAQPCKPNTTPTTADRQRKRVVLDQCRAASFQRTQEQNLRCQRPGVLRPSEKHRAHC